MSTSASRLVTLSDGQAGYLAVPASGRGPGILVLHAWWGLTPLFKSVCDRLAAEGYVALAPDLHRGQTADTVEAAKAIMANGDDAARQKTAQTALDYLRGQPAVRSGGLGTLGFSMGAAWALVLSALSPEITATVLFYGAYSVDFTASRAAFLGHFAEVDEWEPLDGVRQLETDLRAAGREVAFHFYPNVQHWFFEENRPEYNAPAAQQAWQRTLDFLSSHLR